MADEDLVAFERGAVAPLRTGTICGDYLRVRRPGADDLVYVPGELLPDEIAALARAVRDEDYDAAARCWTVQLPAAEAAPAAAKTKGAK